MNHHIFISDSELFPNQLKPKHHFPRVMEIVGPSWNISSMLYDQKHQERKIAARAAKSRINLCQSISVRHQLKLNYEFLRRCPSEYEFSFGPERIKIIGLTSFNLAIRNELA